MKKIWIRIFFVYMLHLLSFMVDYSLLYQNISFNNLWNWINPAYTAQFIMIGIISCVFICKQSPKEFSDNIRNRESLIVFFANIVFVLTVTKIGAIIGNYEINWYGVIYQCVYCLIFVGITEEWIYRGFMVTQLEKVLKKKYAVVIISAIMFSVMHLPSFFLHADNITFESIGYRLLIPLLMGIVFALIFIWKRNLFTLIIIHGVYDLIEQIAFDEWYYMAYAIFWMMIIAYAVYCYKTRIIYKQSAHS